MRSRLTGCRIGPMCACGALTKDGHAVWRDGHSQTAEPGEAVRESRTRMAERRRWRPVAELRSIGLWRATDEAALGTVLASLPLHPWMT
jgi:muconolactone delta-isomerase